MTSVVLASELVRRDERFQLQRIVTDGERLLVKFALEWDDDQHLQREFSAFAELASPLTLTPIRLAERGNRLESHYRDLNPLAPLEPLGEVHDALGDLGSLADELCAILAAFHGKGWGLGTLRSSSLARDSTGRLVLTDAPHAYRLGSSHAPTMGGLTKAELPYAAPEVVVGAALAVDQRADLYSLGIVLYESLTGRTPFQTDVPSELVQCHLAKEPVSLCEYAAWVPPAVAEPVMRLLAKDPANRFESAALFLDELRLKIAGEPVGRSHERSQPFLLGANKHLYGLGPVSDRLLEKCLKTRASPELVLVSGDAGVGKTSLIRTLRGLLPRGHVGCGRFSHAGSAAPLSAWAAPLADLARFVLTTSSAESDVWRARLAHELGESAALICALSSEWALILGAGAEQPFATGDGGLQRVALAIHTLIKAFAEPSAPVVLVFDDIQWADASSLRILESVLVLPEAVNLLVVAAVRSEPEGAIPATLGAFLSGLEAKQVPVEILRLGAWASAELREFLADTIPGAFIDAEPFQEFVLGRTRGNPFYVRELLSAAHEQGALSYDVTLRTWRWHRDSMRRLVPGENVLALLTRRITSLPSELRETLRVAACLGSSFTRLEFAASIGSSVNGVAVRIEPAVREGMLIAAAEGASGDDVFEFSHDRVYEACRALTSDAECAEISLRTAQALLEDQDHHAALTHKIAGYFNVARALLSGPEQRLLGAQLNLDAGLLAKRASAFSQALEYFQCGLALMELAEPHERERAWARRPALRRALLEEGAEAALQCGSFELMHRLCDSILEHANHALDRVRAYEVRIGGLMAEQRFSEGVVQATRVLAELGVIFPARPSLWHTIIGYLSTRRRILAGPIDRLRNLAPNDDASIKAASRILAATYSCAYLGHRNLFPLLVYKHVNHSLEYGNEDYSCVTYSAFALVLAGMGDVKRAFELGEVAIDLLKRPGCERYKAKVFMGYYNFVYPWALPLRDVIPYQTEAIRSALAFGDFEYAGHMLTLRALARIHTGHYLPELAGEIEQDLAKLESLRQGRSILLQRILCQLVHDLSVSTAADEVQSGPYYDARMMLERCLEPLDHNLAFNHYLARVLLALYLEDLDSGLVAADAGRAYLETGAFAIYTGALFVFGETLLCLRAARRRVPGSGARRRRTVTGRKKLKRWAKGAPSTFLHKHHLVEAEYQRLQGKNDLAAWHFERAIELAQTNGFVQDTALAQDLAAEFYLERGMERLGRQCLRECYASYQRWGATRVARRLQARYPEHFTVLAGDSGVTPALRRPSFGDDPDTRVLIRSVQALSSESRLPGVLEGLLRAMFEHAGAQRALLIMNQGSGLQVLGEVDIDRGQTDFARSESLDQSTRVARSIVRYAARTGKPVLVGNAALDDRFSSDPYILERQPKALMVVPMHYQGKLYGVAYLENSRVSQVFTPARLEIASLLAGQAAVAVATASYHSLELQAQQAKIKPHFLFNTLNSIAELTVQDARKAEDAVIKLAQLYRYVLETELAERVNLEQELMMVKNYLNLEKLRYDAKLEFSIRCDPDVRAVEVPGLIIQPLVENCVRHAIAPRVGPGRIWVDARQREGRCEIVVLDDGDGNTRGLGGTGFGLRSVRERLSLLYGENYVFSVDRTSGFRVQIGVPLGVNGVARGSTHMPP